MGEIPGNNTREETGEVVLLLSPDQDHHSAPTPPHIVVVSLTAIYTMPITPSRQAIMASLALTTPQVRHVISHLQCQSTPQSHLFLAYFMQPLRSQRLAELSRTKLQHQAGSRRASPTLTVTAAAATDDPAPPPQLAPEAVAAWNECVARLEAFGLEPTKAHAAVGKAFGWGGQAYWRHEKEEEVPSVAAVEASLEFLASIGISSEADVAGVVSKFPECLAVDVALMQGNVEKLTKTFSMKGAALANGIKRKPRQALGSTIDCEGNCAGECTRCFAQF